MLNNTMLDHIEARLKAAAGEWKWAPIHKTEAAELVQMARIGLLVQQKFTSGNDVPVDRIVIKRGEIDQAIAGERG
jgi:hypothetical protein